MNERIKELALQARCKVMDDGDWYIPSAKGLEKIVYTKGIGLERFAELLIRECCLYLENEAERLYGISASEVDPIFQSNFELCAEKCYDNSKGLKEHFGVEE